MTRPPEGETHTVERTFTVEDVRQFAALSGDDQPRHTDPDDEGRLLVHGLLTATLPTKIGGKLELLASSMAFEFRRPVYTGERNTCTWTNEIVEKRTDGYALTVDAVCEREGEAVLTATIEGIVPKED